MFLYALTPIVATSLPMLTPLILATAGALGYRQLTKMSEEGGELNRRLKQEIEGRTHVEIPLQETILENLTAEVGRAETLNFQKDDMTLTLHKDERGKLRVTMSATKGTDEAMLRAEGKKFVSEIAQALAANKAAEAVERMNADVVEEEVNERGEIVLRIRRWT